MPHIVSEACIRCRYTDCVEVCPVDAFHATPHMLVIGEACIDCGLCIPECGPRAIYPEDDLPSDQSMFKALNLRWSKKFPVITRKETPCKDAAAWKDQPQKRQYLDLSEYEGSESHK